MAPYHEHIELCCFEHEVCAFGEADTCPVLNEREGLLECTCDLLEQAEEE